MPRTVYILAAATILAPRVANADVLTGPFSTTTVLNEPTCNLPGPMPGSRSAVCVVDSVRPVAAECAYACLSDANCTAYTWHAPTLGVWALACVFRLDGAWTPTSGAAGHTSGRKVAPPPWPISDGFDALPTMWFGANVSGLDSPTSLALIARHRVGVTGWQQGTGALEPGANLGAGDAFQAAAATHLSDYLDALPGGGGPRRTLVGVYRQVMIAQRLFAAANAAATDASKDGFWVHDASSGGTCTFGMPWGTKDPVWNFTVQTAADSWIADVVGALAAEAPAAGVRAVFFDDSDYNFCGFWNTSQSGCAPIPFTSLARMHADNNAVLARTAAALNAAGVIPVFSSVNVLSVVGSGAPACALPEESTLAALAGTTFARFYEFFPQLGASGPDVAAASVANAILEGAAGIPVVVHFFSASCPALPRNITRPGRLGGAIEAQLALFLIVQSHQSVFSLSNDWFDASFCWHSEFDVAYGAPLGPALRTGTYTWARNFSLSRVTADVSAATGEVFLL